MARGALLRLQNQDLARAFQAWSDRLAEHYATLMKMRRVAGRWLLLEAAAAFGTWASIAAERARKRRLMERFASRALNMGVARAWASWTERAADNRLMRRMLARYSDRLLFKVWVAWQRHHRRRRASKLRRLAMSSQVRRVRQFRWRDSRVPISGPVETR